jgi:hypothetical protein
VTTLDGSLLVMIDSIFHTNPIYAMRPFISIILCEKYAEKFAEIKIIATFVLK